MSKQRLFNDEGIPKKQFLGIKGYRNYADKFCEGKMYKAFLTVSAVLSPKEFNALSWGKQFTGTTKEHQQVRARVLDSNSKPIDSYQGIKGYRDYADKFCLGKMDKAFITVSAVLLTEEFKSLNWGKCFEGLTDLHQTISKDFKQVSSLSTYHGLNGLKAYAKKIGHNNLRKVRRFVQVVLEKAEFETLDWKPNPSKMN